MRKIYAFAGQFYEFFIVTYLKYSCLPVSPFHVQITHPASDPPAPPGEFGDLLGIFGLHGFAVDQAILRGQFLERSGFNGEINQRNW